MKSRRILLLYMLLMGLCSWLLSAHAQGAEKLSPGSGWLKRDGSWSFKTPIRVLLAGDSLMESLGPQMRDALSSYQNLTFIPIGKKSTGLSRPDFYHWPRVLQKHLAADQPHLVIMWVGTNDPQGIYGMSGLGEPCSKAWQIAYLGKVREIFRLARQHKARLILMGPPVVAEPKLDAQLAQINKLMAWACQNWEKNYGGVRYVDTREILADKQGRYRQEGVLLDGRRAMLRTRDGVHITSDGNKQVMDYLLPYVSLELRRCFSADGRRVDRIRPQGGAGISVGSRR